MKPRGDSPPLAALAVERAAAAIAHHLALIKLEAPHLTPRQQELIARSRCNQLIAQANTLIDLAKARTQQLAPRRASLGA